MSSAFILSILPFVLMILVGVVLNLTPLGKKGRRMRDNYLTPGGKILDDYDAEQKNIDHLSR